MYFICNSNVFKLRCQFMIRHLHISYAIISQIDILDVILHTYSCIVCRNAINCGEVTICYKQIYHTYITSRYLYHCMVRYLQTDVPYTSYMVVNLAFWKLGRHAPILALHILDQEHLIVVAATNSRIARVRIFQQDIIYIFKAVVTYKLLGVLQNYLGVKVVKSI